MPPPAPDDDPTAAALVVAVDYPGGAADVDADWLFHKLAAACRRLALEPVSLNVVIASDAFIADMHQRFMGVAGTTDVITFDLSEETSGGSGGVDGEVYLCLDEARRRCAQLGHPLNHELLLYALHGVLHLLGYDDHDPDEHRAMHEEEDRLLREIGVGAVFKAPME